MSIGLLYPWVLLLFFIYPIFIYLLSKFGNKRIFGNFEMLKRVSSKSLSIDRFLYPLIFFLLLLSISYPIKEGSVEVAQKSSRDILLLLDSSASMREDNRFEVAKKILLRFLDKREDDRVGLVVFGDRAYIASALSSDIKAVKSIIKSLKAGVAGGRDTALYEALYLGATLFDNSNRQKSIILLTDGIDTIKDMPLEVAKAKLKSKNITLFAVGVGSDYKKSILEQLAGSKDRVFTAKSSNQLKSIYDTINLLQSSKNIKKRVKTIKPIYRYPLILATVLMIVLLFQIKEKKILLISILFALLAIFYPNSYITKKSLKDKALAIVMDISQNMRVKDIPPNRFEYQLSRAKELIDESINRYDIALMAFDNQIYLISPPTGDKKALESKIEHLKVKLNKNSDAMIDTLKYTAKILQRYKEPKIVLFTASKLDINELDKIKNIKVPISVYAISSLKGGVIPKDDGTFLEDSSGKVVISYLDTNLANIASLTGGVFGSFVDGVEGWQRLKDALNSTYISVDKVKEGDRGFLFIFIVVSILFLLLAKAYPFIKASR